MRNIYRVLASQYDPLRFILPYTTRAKVLVWHLWDKHQGWDDPLLPQELLQQWQAWEDELGVLPQVNLPRPYLPKEVDLCSLQREVHIFCDASEEAHGSVAYLRSTDRHGGVHLSFLMARSRVAPKQSHSCRFKVFVGTRVAEIQELTDGHVWRFVDSANNPANDVTRGKGLRDLVEPNRWSQGPSFLLQGSDLWPDDPSVDQVHDASELRLSVFCGVAAVVSSQLAPDLH